MHDCASICDSIAKEPQFFAWCIPTLPSIHFYTCSYARSAHINTVQSHVIASLFCERVMCMGEQSRLVCEFLSIDTHIPWPVKL